MDKLSDKILIESYREAKKLQLNPDFVSLIRKEMMRRQLKVKNSQMSFL